jgi:hypothetical protein
MLIGYARVSTIDQRAIHQLYQNDMIPGHTG